MDTHLSTLISKLFFTMLLLITLSLLSLSGAGAQTLQPDKPQLYENETIKRQGRNMYYIIQEQDTKTIAKKRSNYHSNS